MSNEELILNLILVGARQLQSYSSVLTNARAQGRSVSDDDVNALAATDNAVAAAVDAEIARQRA
ncbi:MAG TPA: hypothetical protein VGN16_03985 [Acidobacteriaceae bacterium]|jgi:hypothetical protein